MASTGCVATFGGPQELREALVAFRQALSRAGRTGGRLEGGGSFGTAAFSAAFGEAGTAGTVRRRTGLPGLCCARV